MKEIETIFFELIRVAIGEREDLSRLPSEKEWKAILDMAKKQSLVGVCFAGLQRLGADADEGFAVIGMSEMLYLKWMGMAAQIQQRNELMDVYTAQALEYFRGKGFPCQVLKGQGVARLYGDIADFRQSGDVDVWLGCKREEMYDFARKEYGRIEGLNYYHIHCPIMDDAEVEAHVWPSYLTNPFRNRRLHGFFIEHQPTEGSDDTPDNVFNGVFILLHCYRHFCGRGVGMRQVLDYYYVLKSGFAEAQKAEVLKGLREFGLYRFATAMMWLMKEVFGLEDRYLICECDEKEGMFLLDEVMNTGNMGRGESRIKRDDSSAVRRFVSNQRRNLHLLTHYPSEVCWSPIFNLVRYFWQLTVKKQ